MCYKLLEGHNLGGDPLQLPFLQLLNSDWHDWRGSGEAADKVYDQEWLRSFLSTWDLSSKADPTGDDLTMLTRLRSLIRGIVEAVQRNMAPAGESMVELSRYVQGAELRRRLDLEPYACLLRLEPVRRDWNWVLSEIAASFAEFLSEGDPTRLRTCANPACRWIFYDDTRNRSRRWCEETCGNLMRVRRFRQRNSRAREHIDPRPNRGREDAHV
jgi:predicted RNA-binding Zn ribbon-like protein